MQGCAVQKAPGTPTRSLGFYHSTKKVNQGHSIRHFEQSREIQDLRLKAPWLFRHKFRPAKPGFRCVGTLGVTVRYLGIIDVTVIGVYTASYRAVSTGARAQRGTPTCG